MSGLAAVPVPVLDAVSVRDVGAKSGTVTDAVYRQLHDDILSGVPRPNERRHMRDLQARCGVAFAALRVALSRLRAEDVVSGAWCRHAGGFVDACAAIACF